MVETHNAARKTLAAILVAVRLLGVVSGDLDTGRPRVAPVTAKGTR